MVWGVLGVEGSVWFYGLVVGFILGLAGQKTTRNVTWGSILTLSRKNSLKQLKS